jgi:hypothetical protein
VRKAGEEQQRFDKTEMLSFLPPEITATGTTILSRRFKLYYYPPVDKKNDLSKIGPR